MASSFVEHLVATLSPLLPVTARAMFGGYGIYTEGLIFGLVADDVFYLKVDDGNRAVYEAAGLGPFTYEAKGKAKMSMSYYQVPDVQDAGELKPWIDDALAASRRAAAAKRKSSPRPMDAGTPTRRKRS